VAGNPDVGSNLRISPPLATINSLLYATMTRFSTVTAFVTVLTLVNVDAAGLRFAGVPISPGRTVKADVRLSANNQSYASDAVRHVPETAVAVIGVPLKFDPRKTWPVLVVFSTSDFKRLNRDDLVDFYRDAALKEGWVIIAGDGREFPTHDTNGWRAAMTLAALDALHQSFPGSPRWPVAVAGFSGGAKRASLLAPLLFLQGCRICGLYLSGMNEDVLSVSYRRSGIGREFLKTPIFISSGAKDTIAPLERARSVTLSIQNTGFKSVRLRAFSGGHAVKNDHTVEALRWFRALL
jgi:pimeloyl-ACP methyl ester carboxylesterase